jgi:hypothetical protein
MSAIEFRQRHRAYGERVPAPEISGALASGYRLADEETAAAPDGSLILIPPEKESTPCDA